MRVCANCHASFGCDHVHPVTIIHCGEPCGVCSGPRTELDCVSPVAREIDSYNKAVAHHVLSMRRKFLMNLNDKGGWQEIDYGFAIKRLNHEVGELAAALLPAIKGPSQYQAIIDESADVSNFAVFIGDRASREDFTQRSIQKYTDEVIAKLEAEKKTAGAK
jgi:hypothetical protein